MDPGAFRGAQDIDKSKIVIVEHAVIRFMEHLDELPEMQNRGRRTKNERKLFREEFGFSPEEIPDDLPQAKALIRKLMHYSTHENASWKGQGAQAIFKYGYGEETFYLRNGRWQFRITHSKEGPENFVLKTIVWLNDYRYSLCLQK